MSIHQKVRNKKGMAKRLKKKKKRERRLGKREKKVIQKLNNKFKMR